MVFYTSGRVTCFKINLTDGLFAVLNKIGHSPASPFHLKSLNLQTSNKK